MKNNKKQKKLYQNYMHIWQVLHAQTQQSI